MTKRGALTQKEVTGYAKAMQAAGIPVWHLKTTWPDGTTVCLCAGSAPSELVLSESDEISKALGLE